MNYYNEFDHNAAEWLRQLIADGLIPPGDVDERSICDVGAADLAGYTQCHFFAGIGGWSLALKLVGWPDDRPIWTGSCPCQCFSTAGKQKGFEDERDLWPVLFDLIRQCRPRCVVGEQVENAIRHGWLDRVYADMEGAGYAIGAAVLGAHSVSAPHQRQRLYWGCVSVANVQGDESSWYTQRGECVAPAGKPDRPSNSSNVHRLSDTAGERCREARRSCARSPERLADGGTINGVGNAESDDKRGNPMPGAYGERREDRGSSGDERLDDPEGVGRGICDAENIGTTDREIDTLANTGDCDIGLAYNIILGMQTGISGQNTGNERDTGKPINGSVSSVSPWSNSRCIYCRDKKVRRIPAESILFGVADGLSSGVDGSGVESISEGGGFPLTTRQEGRAMLLKGYGNAIVPQAAAEFIVAFMGGE